MLRIALQACGPFHRVDRFIALHARGLCVLWLRRGGGMTHGRIHSLLQLGWKCRLPQTDFFSALLGRQRALTWASKPSLSIHHWRGRGHCVSGLDETAGEPPPRPPTRRWRMVPGTPGGRSFEAFSTLPFEETGGPGSYQTPSASTRRPSGSAVSVARCVRCVRVVRVRVCVCQPQS